MPYLFPFISRLFGMTVPRSSDWSDSCILQHDRWSAAVSAPSGANLVQRQIKMHELKQLFIVPSCIPVSAASLRLIRKICMVTGGAVAFSSSELLERLRVVWSYTQISSKWEEFVLFFMANT